MENSRKVLRLLLLGTAILPMISRQVLAEPPKEDEQARIAALITDLDSDKFATREAASTELLRIGTVALSALKTTLEHPASPEVRTRAEYLVHEISIWGGEHREIRLSDILEQVKLANRADDPTTACNDGKLEKLLIQCVRVLGGVAGRTDSKLPLDFKDVSYFAYNPQERHGAVVENNAMLILKRGRIVNANHCVILADEQIDVTFAQDSIIVARVAANVTSCHNCIVIAGLSLTVSTDDGSVLLSGSQAEFQIINNSICSAAGNLQMAIPENVTVVNSNSGIDRSIPGRKPTRYVQLPELKLTNPMAKNSLAERIHVTDVLPERDGIALFRLKDGRGEYVARYDQAINDPTGQPIAELKGWILCFAGRGSAVFTNGDEFAALPSDP